MIVTVTLNPALHVGYETERLRLGEKNPVSRVSYRTGGRGLAVARVLHTFGHDVVAAGLAGGASGEMIRSELARAGVATQFTWISGESRRVVEVADEGGPGEGGLDEGGRISAITTFCEPAPYITTEELGRLAADYRALMADATAAVLSGSLPAGLPAETYGSLATYAAEAGVPVVLDAGGSALRHGVSRRPALVIPEPDDGDPAALIANGARAVAILSDGRVSVITGEGQWSAELVGQREAAVSGAAAAASGKAAAASRDALAAGFAPGIALNWTWPDTLAHAVALAASSGAAGELDLEAYEGLLPDVIVTAQKP